MVGAHMHLSTSTYGPCTCLQLVQDRATPELTISGSLGKKLTILLQDSWRKST